VPVVSNVTGQLLTGEEMCSPGYWARHVRQPVRFADGVETALAAGVDVFVECGPDNTASAMAAQCVPDDVATRLIPALRAGGDSSGQLGEAESFVAALGALHTAGHAPDWDAFYHGSGAKPVLLPTYAFQREHYWLSPPEVVGAGSGVGDVSGEVCRWSLGGTRQVLPAGGAVHALRVGPGVQAYLADHRVFGRVVVPGAFHVSVLLAVAASWWPGRSVALVDVRFVAALVVDEAEADLPVQVHLVPDDDDTGESEMLRATVASWQHDQWTVHAHAHLTPTDEPAGLPVLPAVPPPEEMETTDSLLDSLRAVEVDWGPRWRWLSGFRNTGDACHGSFTVPEGVDPEGTPVPAGLLDNAFAVAMSLSGHIEDGTPQLPFHIERLVWNGRHRTVRTATGAGSSSQESMTRVDDLVGRGAAGEPVFHLEGFTAHRAPMHRFLAPRHENDLFRIALEPVDPDPMPSESTSGESRTFRHLPAFETDVTALTTESTDTDETPTIVVEWPDLPPTSDAVRDATKCALSWIQAWLGSEVLGRTRLVWVTRNGMAIGDEATSPAAAAVWGLGRTAQSEHPDRSLVLLDVDAELDHASLDSALRALPPDEPQLVLRGGTPHVPRLTPVEATSSLPDTTDDSGVRFDTSGTVLVTGATGGLGRIVSRHLVTEHGVRHLLLLSRSGTEAPGADDLVAELEELGAETVTLRACDVSVRQELAAALDTIPSDHPLRSVVHVAGIVDDGLLADLTDARVEATLRAKVDAALLLHELTESTPMSAFVLFSSVAGTFGSAAQGSYAAANAALDALASRRRALGLAATSLAWGPWSESGMAADMDEALRRRLRREGLRFIDPESGMRLFDEALARPEAVLAPVPLDRGALREAGGVASAPPPLRGLVPARESSERAREGTTLADTLLRSSEAERPRVVLEAVRAEIAAVLGFGSAEALPAQQALQELGLDSLMAVEVRNRLSGLVGEKLPVDLLFSYPTAQALADRLSELLTPDEGEPDEAEQARELVAALERFSPEALERSGATRRLLDLTYRQRQSQDDQHVERQELEEASDEELLEILDEEISNR
ncbi:Phosphopantetheine attachment site, partial [Actinopolyspora alba]